MYFPDIGLHSLHTATASRLQQAYRPGTRVNQQVQLTRYYTFCRRFHLTDLNPSPQQVTWYLEYLSQNLRSSQTVKNYLSAIAFLHRQFGLECTALHSHQVTTMLRAIDHTLRSPIIQKLPITIPILVNIVHLCDQLGTWGLIMKCAVLFCFFGFLRQSNVAPRSPQLHDRTRDTMRSDVNITHHGLVLRLKWTKTHQRAHTPVFIRLPRISGSALCPTAAYQQMCVAWPTLSSRSPLLFYTNSCQPATVVTTRMLANQFRNFIHRLHLPPHTYTLHSLRKGGATLCHTLGLPIEQIKAHGTWSSDVVWTYIDPSTSAVSSAMSRAIGSYNV
jgi:hypothetical protein